MAAEPLLTPAEEDRLCAVVQAGTDELLARVGRVYAAEQSWAARIRAVAYELLRFLREDPERARAMTVGVLSAGKRAQAIRDNGMQALIELIDQGRAELPDPGSMSRATAEGIAGAIYTRIHVTVESGDFSDSERMARELMYNVVLPYLGTEAALAELHHPPPPDHIM